MANPTCSVAIFTAQGACFKMLGSKDRLAILIYFMALELQAIGGTNYLAELGPAGLLEQDSKCYKNLSLDNLLWEPGFPYLVIAKNNAVNAGATVSSDINVIKAAVKCLVNYPTADKMAMFLNLTCKLGSHKAYPQ